MPYKKSYRRKTYSRKRVYRRKWSKKRKVTYKRLDTGLFKLKYTTNVTSGTGNLYAEYRLTEPTNVDGAAATVSDWTSVANLYDQFRVCGLAVKWIPNHPFDPSSVVGYRPLFVYTDFDQTGLVLANSDAIAYANMKIKNLFKPWSYFVRIPKMMNAASTTVSKIGYMDTGSPSATGSLYISQAAGLTNSSIYGTVILTYYIKAIQRR